MKERKPEILYSEPIKEIMGNPPGKIVRMGTSTIFIVLLMLILFSWLIRYPDTLPSSIEITTSNPPVTLVSKITGRIQHLYVKERERVNAGQLVAVMETTASVEEILALKQSLDTIHNAASLTDISFPGFARLGELQGYYSAYRKNLSDLVNYNANDFYGNKITSMGEEIKGIKDYITGLAVKERFYSENQKIEMRKYKRDSILFAGKIIPESQLDISYQVLIKNSIELQQVKLEHSAKLIELSEKQQLMQDYTINRLEEKEKLVSILEESFLNLKAQINLWENNYMLISPVDGIATFTKFWSANQSVIKDEAVISIVPVETGDFVGRINLRMNRSGKVKTGQLVNIKLSGYPYLEYGMVRGIVRSISLVPAANTYVIEIDLPQGLTTLYGLKLDFTQNMQGTAEIITEDIRIIHKIVNPFRYLISKNKR